MGKLAGQITRRIIAMFLSLMLIASIGLPFFFGTEISAAGNTTQQSIETQAETFSSNETGNGGGGNLLQFTSAGHVLGFSEGGV